MTSCMDVLLSLLLDVLVMYEKDVGLSSYLLHPKFVRISRELSLHLTPVITRHTTSEFHVKKTSLQRLLPAGV